MIAFGVVLLLCKGDVVDKIQCTWPMRRATNWLWLKPLSHTSPSTLSVASVAVAFYFFDFKNKGRKSMRPDELILFMDCAMKGVSKVKRLPPPPFDVIVQTCEGI